MTEYPGRPAGEGWVVSERRTAGPFTTGVIYRHRDGRRLEWSSRGHRKHPSSRSRGQSGARRGARWQQYASWGMAVLFMAGSTCFLVAPLPAFLTLVGADADAAVFFTGSLLFTAAASLQWLETLNADVEPTPLPGHGSVRLVSWEPGRIDWWSCGVQLVGTLFFNVTTFRALSTGVGSSSYDRLVWRPDAFGSACFLVSGYLAYVEVTGGLHRPVRTLEGVLVAVNLLGCLAFGVSAVAEYVVHGASSPVDVALVNLTTSLGALAFLVGAVLLLPEAARGPTTASP